MDFDFAGINRGDIIESTASTRSEVWVSLPTSHPAMVAVQAWDEPEEITVSIWVTYLSDPDEEYVLRFTGRVTGIEPGKILSRLICEDPLTDMDRASAAQVASVDCRHNHYVTEADGTGCRLGLADWQQTVEVTAITAKVLTVPLAALQPDGTYRLGILEYAGREYLIASHTGATLVLDRIVPGLAAAVALSEGEVLIAPGCDKKIGTCLARFANVLNFGGNPGMIRGESPFDGGSIA